MKLQDLQSLIPSLLEISKEVSETIMEYYKSDFEITNKSDDSPVTSADFASNNIIVPFLESLTPDVYILSEEISEIDPSLRLHRDWIWCIDPLDGTKEFIKKNGEFSVNIALIHKGMAVLGVVILPAFNKIFYAVKNEGAYEVLPDGLPKKMEFSALYSQSTVRAMTSISHHNKDTEDILAKRYGYITWIPKGSSLKLIELAESKADIYLKIGKTMEWDIAAPQVILEECGGSIVSYPDHLPLQYNKKDLLNPNFIAVRKGFQM
jgi:3'(2'), 5'-bisphosphate nucleotidase